MKKTFFTVLFFFSAISYAYERPNAIDEATWNDLKPFFLPENHPIKSQLDTLFQKERLTLSKNHLKKSGFKVKQSKIKDIQNRAYIAKHPKLRGFLLKIQTDDQAFVGEWLDWKKRILGAHYIRKAIQSFGYESEFTVPSKWIYPIPDQSLPPGNYHQKYFLLVVEDMKIIKEQLNYKFWQSIRITPQLLDKLYNLLKTVGLFDSMYPDNIPFTKSGKIAFIDTQHFHGPSDRLNRLTPYLYYENQVYWERLIRKDEG